MKNISECLIVWRAFLWIKSPSFSHTSHSCLLRGIKKERKSSKSTSGGKIPSKKRWDIILWNEQKEDERRRKFSVCEGCGCRDLIIKTHFALFNNEKDPLLTLSLSCLLSRFHPFCLSFHLFFCHSFSVS